MTLLIGTGKLGIHRRTANMHNLDAQRRFGSTGCQHLDTALPDGVMMDLKGKGLRDSTELVVHQIWRDSLDLSDFSIYEDFFELGGSSMTALKVLGAVRAHFGIELSLKALWEYPTVERFSQALRSGETMPRGSYTSMRAGSAGPSLVCVHPLGGSIIWFSDLAEALSPGISVIGLQAAGLDPRGMPHYEVTAMAKDYLAELLEKHSAEDLLLTGLSFGGLVAYEMASQLEKMATPPRGLILLDTIIPTWTEKDLRRSDLLAKLVWSALDLPLDVEELAKLEDDDLCDSILSAALKYNALPADYGMDHLRRLINIYPINAAAACRYTVPEYRGPVHLLKPAEAPSFAESDAIWHRQCAGDLTVLTVSGEHATIIAGSNAIHVARIIEDTWFATRVTPSSTAGGHNGIPE